MSLRAEEGTLGILAGGGTLPVKVADAAVAAGRPVFVIVLEEWGQPQDFAHVPHAVVRGGAGGRMRDLLRQHGVRQLVLAGWVRRPSLASVRPDAAMVGFLARLGRAVFAGDDGLLKAGVRLIEEEGFQVVPAQAVLRDLLPQAGLLGAHAPDAAAQADIRRGVTVARALGTVDVGQAVVVQQGLVLGVEAIEGTDALLARCAGLRREGPGGVLVKLVKPGQDRRVDLPTLGPATMRNAAAAGLRGIAAEAAGTILVDRAGTVAAADAAGLFLLMLDPDVLRDEETIP